MSRSLGNETALHDASKQGNISVVKTLIAAQVDVNLINTQGWTALHLASQGGYTAIIETLMAAGAFIDIQTKNIVEINSLNRIAGYKMATEKLFAAASNSKTSINDFSLILSTLKTGLNGRLRKYKNNTALHIAIENNPILALMLITKETSIDILGDNKLSVRDQLHNLHAQKPYDDNAPIIRLCLAYSKVYDLIKRVSQYTQDKVDKPIIDTAMSATATSTNALASASASASDTFPSSFETLRAHLKLEEQLVEINKFLDEQHMEEDHSLNSKEKSETDSPEAYFQFQKQSLNFKLAEFISRHHYLFPNTSNMAKQLLQTIKQKHPYFKMANALIVDIMDRQTLTMPQPSPQDNTFITKKIEHLLFAGEKSEHYNIQANLMADALDHGLDNQELRRFTNDQTGLMLVLFNKVKNQSNLVESAQKNAQKALIAKHEVLAEEQTALAKEQKANREIEKLKLSLNAGNRDNKIEIDKTTIKSNSCSVIHSGSKRKREKGIASTASATAARSVFTTSTEILHSDSSKPTIIVTATSMNTTTFSPTSCQPKDSGSAIKDLKFNI